MKRSLTCHGEYCDEDVSQGDVQEHDAGASLTQTTPDIR